MLGLVGFGLILSRLVYLVWNVLVWSCLSSARSAFVWFGFVYSRFVWFLSSLLDCLRSVRIGLIFVSSCSVRLGLSRFDLVSFVIVWSCFVFILSECLSTIWFHFYF